MTDCKFCGARGQIGKCDYCGSTLETNAEQGSVVYHLSKERKEKLFRGILKKVCPNLVIVSSSFYYGYCYLGKPEVFKEVEVESGWWIFKGKHKEKQRTSKRQRYLHIEADGAFFNDRSWFPLTIAAFHKSYNKKAKQLAEEFSQFTSVQVILA